MNIELEERATTANAAETFGTSTTSGALSTSALPLHSPDQFPNQQPLEDAVYSYMRAVRALGRTKINTMEIAQALRVREVDVVNTLASLQRRGVKIVP